LAVFFGSIYLFGSDQGRSFPSKGETHRFANSADPTRRCDPRMRWLLPRTLRPAVVWTCAWLATIGVPIGRALDLQQYIGQLYHTGWTAKNGLAGAVSNAMSRTRLISSHMRGVMMKPT
jgi:hypothetical protein